MLGIATRLFGQPQWLLEHLHLYGQLAETEVKLAARAATLRAAWGLGALACAAVALNLAGVALLLGATGSAATSQATWALFAIPALPTVAAAAAWWMARRDAEPWFVETRRQFALDAAWLQQLGEVPVRPPAPTPAPPPPTLAPTHASP